MKPDIKSEYEVSFYGTEKTAIITYSYYKEVPSGDYDTPDDPATVEIDKIEIGGVDMTYILLDVSEEWTEGVIAEILEHCKG